MMQRNKRNGSRKKMMVRRSIKLVSVKKYKSLRREIMGASAKYGLDLYREIKEMKQTKSWSLNKVWIWLV